MVLTVVKARQVGECRIHVTFNDGGECLVDLAEFLDGEVFAPLKDVAYFKRFAVVGNTIEWPNGADFAPEFLREIGQEVGGEKAQRARRPAMVAEETGKYRVRPRTPRKCP